MAQEQVASDHTLKAIVDAFNAHDLDAIMEFFADDCIGRSSTDRGNVGAFYCDLLPTVFPLDVTDGRDYLVLSRKPGTVSSLG